jgi:hypothetical protein
MVSSLPSDPPWVRLEHGQRPHHDFLADQSPPMITVAVSMAAALSCVSRRPGRHSVPGSCRSPLPGDLFTVSPGG